MILLYFLDFQEISNTDLENLRDDAIIYYTLMRKMVSRLLSQNIYFREELYIGLYFLVMYLQQILWLLMAVEL